MSSHLFRAAALVLAAAAAFSSSVVLAGDYRHWHHRDHSGLVRLNQISAPQGFAQQQPARIVLMEPREAANAGTYAGSADVYQANGGTYVVGYGGYNPYARPAAVQPRPRAKVINVRYAGNPCSYEAGVCVIRP
ncbi:hypothetical protein A6U86_23625 [Rhizobium sp. AC27/96]|uniref:hypothetical protein n=1 Tax=Rhizobium sp. AC27/96 TaxID=1841653 RepID=UPI00082848D5|nr:hypothetical protein [Rhizobium sp. AC27/96]OCJ10971.1 hypothetical protein A6U86_23625 [Rhizobium sp. AC27/96]